MTVAENIGFHLKVKRVPKDERARRVGEAARILDLEPYLDRKPAKLSGGQRQRVAMGRAIVRQPQVFLMDEPLSNLDAQLRVQTRTQIAALQRRLNVTTVYVTHDQVEAMTMGDRVAVLDRGVLQQCASPKELFTDPVNLFVAGFIGSPQMNLLAAKVGADGAVHGSLTVAVDAGAASGGDVGRDHGRRASGGLAARHRRRACRSSSPSSRSSARRPSSTAPSPGPTSSRRSRSSPAPRASAPASRATASASCRAPTACTSSTPRPAPGSSPRAGVRLRRRVVRRRLRLGLGLSSGGARRRRPLPARRRPRRPARPAVRFARFVGRRRRRPRRPTAVVSAAFTRQPGRGHRQRSRLVVVGVRRDFALRGTPAHAARPS